MRKRLVGLNLLMEDGEQDQAPQNDYMNELYSSIDHEMQKRMGDVAKIREMFNDVVREAKTNDEEGLKKAFMERLGNMIYKSDEKSADPEVDQNADQAMNSGMNGGDQTDPNTYDKKREFENTSN